MIHFSSPFRPDKELAQAYNDEMKLIGEDDHMVFTDYDVCFINHKSIDNIFKWVFHYPADLLTCLTNRTGYVFPHQVYNRKQMHQTNIMFWHRVSEALSGTNNIVKVNKEISGFCMVLSKELWEKVGGFKRHENDEKALGVDCDFSQKVVDSGRNVYVMRDVFAFHFYRMNKNISDKSHLR